MPEIAIFTALKSKQHINLLYKCNHVHLEICHFHLPVIGIFLHEVLHTFSPLGRPVCSFRPQLDFSGKTFSDTAITVQGLFTLIFHPLSIARYLFIQWIAPWRRGENKNAQISKRQEMGIKTGILGLTALRSTAELTCPIRMHYLNNRMCIITNMHYLK